MAFRGARATKTGTQSIAGNTDVVVSWDAAALDTDSIWSGGSPTRLTVPSGVTRVKLAGCAYFSTGNSANYRAWIRKGGTDIIAITSTGTTGGTVGLIPETGPIAVTSGDYFELMVYNTNATARNLGAGVAFFAMTIL